MNTSSRLRSRLANCIGRTELTADGRSGRFSPDGRFILYEVGLETSRRTRVLRNDDSRTCGRRTAGRFPKFAPDGTKVAYLRVNETDDIKSAAAALDAATLTAQNRGTLVQGLTWLIARDSTIVVLDIASDMNWSAGAWPAQDGADLQRRWTDAVLPRRARRRRPAHRVTFTR